MASSIQQFLNKILSSRYGKDVRQAIHDSIEQCYDDVTNPDLNTEAFETAVQNKIDDGSLALLTIPDGSITKEKLDQDINDTINSLSEGKLNKNYGKENSGKYMIVGENGDIIPGDIVGITEDVKQSLLNIVNHIWYTDENSKIYIEDLYNALYPPKDLLYITADFEQTSEIYNTISLDLLKGYLTVTAYYNSYSEAVTNYYLSGELKIGESEILVTYKGKTTSFKVNVSQDPKYVIDIGTLPIVDGYYYDDKGGEVSKPLRALERDFISVFPNKTYYWTQLLKPTPIPFQLCEYDQNKSFISRSLASFDSDIRKIITTSGKTHYFRISWGTTEKEKRPGYIGVENVANNISITLAYVNDENIENILDLASKISVFRDGKKINVDFGFEKGIFNFKHAANHLSASPSDTRIYNSKSVILLDGDIIKFDGVKYGLCILQPDGSKYYSSDWVIDNSEYIIGG